MHLLRVRLCALSCLAGSLTFESDFRPFLVGSSDFSHVSLLPSIGFVALVASLDAGVSTHNRIRHGTSVGWASDVGTSDASTSATAGPSPTPEEEEPSYANDVSNNNANANGNNNANNGSSSSSSGSSGSGKAFACAASSASLGSVGEESQGRGHGRLRLRIRGSVSPVDITLALEEIDQVM